MGAPSTELAPGRPDGVDPSPSSPQTGGGGSRRRNSSFPYSFPDRGHGRLSSSLPPPQTGALREQPLPSFTVVSPRLAPSPLFPHICAPAFPDPTPILNQKLPPGSLTQPGRNTPSSLLPSTRPAPRLQLETLESANRQDFQGAPRAGLGGQVPDRGWPAWKAVSEQAGWLGPPPTPAIF